MRLIMLTSRSKTIFTFPIRISTPPPPTTTTRNFTTICRRPNPNLKFSSYIGFRASFSAADTVSFLQRNHVFPASRCISSISTYAASTVDWNEAVIGGSEEEEINEASKSFISVRAFFFSTSVDLKSLVEQNKQNFIPPSSRMTNYVVLRFGDLRPDPNACFFHNLAPYAFTVTGNSNYEFC